MKKLKIKMFNGCNYPPVKIPEGDLVDLSVQSDYNYLKGDIVTVSFGFACELPKGYEAHIYPRSSTYQRYGLTLTNSVGIIDNSYNGNTDMWMAKFKADRDGSINAGDRVAQFRIVENQPELEFSFVENLHNEDRGGYGSTGK